MGNIPACCISHGDKDDFFCVEDAGIQEVTEKDEVKRRVRSLPWYSELERFQEQCRSCVNFQEQVSMSVSQVGEEILEAPTLSLDFTDASKNDIALTLAVLSSFTDSALVPDYPSSPAVIAARSMEIKGLDLHDHGEALTQVLRSSSRLVHFSLVSAQGLADFSIALGRVIATLPLKSLTLASCGILSPAQVESLLSVAPQTLCSISFAGTTIGDAGIAAVSLALNAQGASLNAFDMSSCGAEFHSITELAATNALEQLQQNDLDHCLSPACAPPTLDSEDVQPDERCVLDILCGQHRIERVSLAHLSLSDAAVGRALRALSVGAPDLIAIDFSGLKNLGSLGEVLSAHPWPKLAEFTIDDCGLDDESLAAIIRGLGSPVDEAGKRADLPDSEEVPLLSTSIVHYLRTHPAPPISGPISPIIPVTPPINGAVLHTLAIGRNKGGAATVEALTCIPDSLITLDVSYTFTAVDGALLGLCKALGRCSGLQALSIAGLSLAAGGGKVLSELMSECTLIQYLDIRDTELDDEGAEALSAVTSQPGRPRVIVQAAGNPCSDEVLISWVKALDAQ